MTQWETIKAGAARSQGHSVALLPQSCVSCPTPPSHCWQLGLDSDLYFLPWTVVTGHKDGEGGDERCRCKLEGGPELLFVTNTGLFFFT